MFGFCWHNYEDVETQISKGMLFGFAGCEMPGYRLVQVCKKCGKRRYTSLNITMPMKYLYDERIWRSNEKTDS